MKLKEKLIKLKNLITNKNVQEETRTPNTFYDQNVAEFDLELILFFTANVNCLKNQMDMFHLPWFLYPDIFHCDTVYPPKNATENIVKHLLTLYPELKDVKYNKDSGISKEEWLSIQKEKFGNTLPVCKFYMSLEQQKVKSIKNN